MSDKRQRARVQGSWAKQLPKPPGPKAAVPKPQQPQGVSSAPASWGSRPQLTPQTYEFHQPSKPVRDVPAEKVIEKAGDYEISHGPSGVSILRLLHGFLPTDDADWMFSKLLAELPWSQKSNVRQGESYAEPRLTCWFGELPYTYARSTMAANAQWHPLLVTLREAVEQEEHGDYTYVERIRVPLSHGTLLLMEGATQDDWQHQVAKEYHDRGPRINLTFRTIYPEPEGHRPGTKLRFTAKQP
ncbi:alpha-ketoglutarate-dependent dioxygenase alkB homolog 3 isoform 1-T1 [Aulostomus maculatus]